MTASLEVVLAEIGAAAQQIHETVHAATPEQLTAPSPLPDWTRAHVAAHIAGFSDGMARQFEYALRGEQIEQYTGGQDARNGAIDTLAAYPADEIRVEVSAALDHLAASIDAMGEEDWARPISYRQGIAFGGLEAAWREYAIHLVDLDLGATTDGWSEAFCAHLFDFLGERVPEGAALILSSGVRLGDGAEVTVDGSDQDVAAWLAGREPRSAITFSTGTAPELGPWPAR